MAWTDVVDGYCERLGPGLWAEPLNAVSNLGFIIAGALLLRASRRQGEPAAVQALAVLLLLIGLGSAAFHTLATRWAGLLDVLFIALYIFWFVACYARYRWAAPWWLALGSIALYQALAFAITRPFEAGALNGSVGYLPALLGLLLFGLLTLWRDGFGGARWLFAAAAVFTVSLTLRTVDESLCAVWPYGTHWAWHLLNAVTLSLATQAIRTTPALPRHWIRS